MSSRKQESLEVILELATTKTKYLIKFLISEWTYTGSVIFHFGEWHESSKRGAVYASPLRDIDLIGQERDNHGIKKNCKLFFFFVNYFYMQSGIRTLSVNKKIPLGT
jgi:hypothetical protein